MMGDDEDDFEERRAAWIAAGGTVIDGPGMQRGKPANPVVTDAEMFARIDALKAKIAAATPPALDQAIGHISDGNSTDGQGE